MQATKSPVAPSPVRPAVAVTKAIQAKFRQAMAEISARLIERNDEVALCLTGLIARENVLLVGPPGTAKSLLAKNVSELLDVGPGGYFEWQFSRFTEVDEIFGPYDLMALKTAGNYVRRTDAKLPVATVAFLDEYWNASSAVANSLHRLMNERTFDDGTGSRQVPLKFVVAASNIFPSAATGHENCEAAFDRFLLRREVQQVRSKPGRQRLLQDDTLRNPAPLTNKISLVEIEQAQKESASLPVAPETWVAIEKILEAVENEAGQLIMDRRIQKCVNACRAFAYLSGASEVLPEHLEILAHCLWVDPKMWRKVGEIVMRIANPMAVTIATLLSEADQVAATVDFGNRARLIATGNEAMVKMREIRTKIAAMRPPKGSNLPVNPRVLSAINMVDTMGKSLNERIVKSSWVEESI